MKLGSEPRLLDSRCLNDKDARVIVRVLAMRRNLHYIKSMTPTTALTRLKAHEAELRRMGVASLSVFGSTARGEAGPASDVDLAATFAEEAKVGAFRFAEIALRLGDVLGVPVDLVGEPARKPAMQRQIDRDRLHVF